MILRRRFLTLIEVMIVASILLLAAGAIGFNIRKALITQRFNTETSLFVDTVRLAQDMMLILSKDVHVKVHTNAQEIEYFIEVEGGELPGWEKVLKRSHRRMKAVLYVAFEQQDALPATPGWLDLHFQSKGSSMSKGELRLSSHQDPYTETALRCAVTLHGYPHALFAQSIFHLPARNEMWIASKNQEDTAQFFEQLTAYTKEEIEQDGKNP